MTLSPTTLRLLSYLPPTYGLDPDDTDALVVRVQSTFATELDRARQVLLDMRDSTIPAMTDDRIGMLSRWERTLKLPVAPAGASIEQRRAKVVAAFKARRSASGQKWNDTMTTAIGSTAWTAEENAPAALQLRLTIPYSSGGVSAGAVERIARRITPAHLDIVMRYQQGFIVGVSRVGDAL